MSNTARGAAKFVATGLSGGTCESVVTFHIKAVDSREPFTIGDMALLNGAIWDWWRFGTLGFPAVRTAYSIDTALVEASSRVVQPAVGDPVIDARAPVGGADAVNAPLPPQCAVGVTLQTLEVGRSGRGRIYMPAPPDTWADGVGAHMGDGWNVAGRWAAHLAARVQAIYGPFGPFVLAVFSRKLGEAHAVTGFRVASHLVTQRRRRVWPRAYLDVPITG